MRYKVFIVFFVLLIIFSSLQASVKDVPTPEKYFGFKVGSDKKLIDWNQISQYFKLLSQRSDRMKLREIGRTTLDRPMYLAIFSSSNNIKNLKKYKMIQQKLANPYGISTEASKQYAKMSKVVVLISLNIHSTEIASSQESVELAYEFAVSENPKINKILKNVIILMVPSLNPDGQQMITDWYKKWIGTEHEGVRMPYLYHYYAGHDNNRDWYMFKLKESRAVAPILYKEWYPEIVMDQHQMGSSGARLFLPPYAGPVNLNINPILLSEVNLLGKYVISDMHAQGFKGLSSGAFSAYFEGTMSKTPLWKNMVGILTEAASVRLASPIYFPRGSLRNKDIDRPSYSHTYSFLDPWEGGWWKLRDIINYEKAATYSILELAAIHKEKFIGNFFKMNKEAILKGKTMAPYAYLIPDGQHDPGSAEEMLKILSLNGIRISKTTQKIEIEGVSYPEGTYTVSLAQPFRPCIKDLFGVQKYPTMRLYPGGPPRRPYDITGWTLPLLMGVKIVAVNKPLEAELIEAKDLEFYKSETSLAKADFYLIKRANNNSYKLINILLTKEIPVYSSIELITIGKKTFPVGSFIVSGNSQLNALSEKFKVSCIPLSKKPLFTPIKQPRLGIYQSWTGSMDEGWTRLVLDNFKFKYSVIHNKEIRKGKLSKKFGTIIIPDIRGTKRIMEGISGKQTFTPGQPKPVKKYTGGIGKKGLKSLQEFVDRGGNLLVLGRSCNFAIEKFNLPVKNVLKDVSNKIFYSPGSILKIRLDKTHPISYGMKEYTPIRYSNHPVFNLYSYTQESRAVGYFEEGNPLLSGWLIGHDRIEGKTVLADIPVGSGRIILFGFGVQNRAQTSATFKLFFNALLLNSTEMH